MPNHPYPIWTKYWNKYNFLVKNNPLLVTEIENVLRWFSYLLSGRFNSSNIISELIYSTASLLQLMNDIILRKHEDIKINLSGNIEKLKIFATVIEYIQVFFEFAAKKIAGEIGKWIIITSIQLIKTVIKLILLLKFGEGIQKQIPYPPLERNKSPKFKPPTFSCFNNAHLSNGSQFSNRAVANTFKLNRSGRIMKSLNYRPSIQNQNERDWSVSNFNKLLISFINDLDNINTIGEVLHILKPLIHLSAMAKFGEKSWKPFFISLGMDIISLRLLNNSSTHYRSRQEKLEMSKRTVSLLFYLLRSPFFDNYSKTKILKSLGFISEKIPIIGLLFKPMIIYLPEWQQTYFYIWAA